MLWTLVYDTLYAHQDRNDDRALGVGSSALALGVERTKPALLALAGASGALLCATAHANGLGAPMYAAAALGTGQLAWQVASADLDDPENLAARFRSNAAYGAIVFGGVVGGRLLG